MSQFYFDPSRENDPHALPDAETFYANSGSKVRSPAPLCTSSTVRCTTPSYPKIYVGRRTTMKRYADWKPTQFDTAGLGLEDRQDWFVAPVSRTRDTCDALTLSNFEAVLSLLGGESETVEVHRFSHWGPGWFEIILAAPCHEAALHDIQARLEDYPVLNEDRMAELECEQEDEDWQAWGRARACTRHGQARHVRGSGGGLVR